MNLFESLSMIGLLLGGLWALLQYHLSISKQLEEEKDKRHQALLDGIRGFIESISDKLKEMELKLDSTMDNIHSEITQLKVAMSAFSVEVKQNKEDIVKTHDTFMDLLEKVRSYQARHVGEDAYKIETKKREK